MTQRTPIHLYLEKIKQGDLTFLAKLCQQLSDRLIYVPIITGPEVRKSNNQTITFKAVRLDEETKKRVPIFTTEKTYQTWAQSFGEPTEYISLLGGDFCGALEEGTFLVVDPGSEYSVELEPATVRKVASSTTVEIGKGPTDPMIPAPMFNEPSRGRSDPTSLMPRPQRPQVEMDEDVHQPKIHSPARAALPDTNSKEKQPSLQSPKGSIQDQIKRIKREEFPDYKPTESKNDLTRVPQSYGKKPVILSPDTDANRVVREKENPNKKKKRSFLTFLKGE